MALGLVCPQCQVRPTYCPPSSHYACVSGVLSPPSTPQHSPQAGLAGTLREPDQRWLERIPTGQRDHHKASGVCSQNPPWVHPVLGRAQLSGTHWVGLLYTSEHWGAQVLQSPHHPLGHSHTEMQALLAGPRGGRLGGTSVLPSACFLGSCLQPGKQPQHLMSPSEAWALDSPTIPNASLPNHSNPREPVWKSV